jgi:hypothetical protein
MKIDDIKMAIQNSWVRITDHTDEEAEADDLTFDEIYFLVSNGEIIEQYPGDKPYPSSLINGLTFSGDAVHSVWAFNRNSGWAVLITVYRPDPDRWIDFRTREER